MTVVNARELKQQRAALKAEARQILDRAEQEKRDLTAEEEQTFDRLMADAEAIGKRIERLERLASLPSGDDVPEPIAGRRGQPGAAPGSVGRDDLRASAEYREAWHSYVRRGMSGMLPDELRMLQEVRALSTTSDPEGGYLVPTEFERTLITALTDQNIMRRLASVVTSGTDRQIPVVTQRPSFTWLGESQTFTETDIRFGTRLIGAHKVGGIILVPEELLADSAFDLEAFIRQEFGLAASVAEEAAYVNGTGVGQPTGIVVDAEVGVTAAANNAITADEVIDLFHSLKRPYRSRATWLAADATVKAIRKLKDSNGQYLWQPGLVQDRPDTILGRPVDVSDYVPAIGAGNKSLLFGDFSYYRIQQRAGISMQRLVERYADKGQVGFRAWMRVDGKLLLTEGVKALKHP